MARHKISLSESELARIRKLYQIRCWPILDIATFTGHNQRVIARSLDGYKRTHRICERCSKLKSTMRGRTYVIAHLLSSNDWESNRAGKLSKTCKHYEALDRKLMDEYNMDKRVCGAFCVVPTARVRYRPRYQFRYRSGSIPRKKVMSPQNTVIKLPGCRSY